MADVRITARVRLDAVPDIRARLDEVNKKAAKLGTPPVLLEVGKPVREEFIQRSGFPQKIWVVDVVVVGDAPRISGWELVAVLEAMDTAEGKAYLIRTVPGVENIPSLQKRDPNNCDHCRTRRYRKETFVLRDSSGAIKQVGRECLKDFFGHDPAKLIQYMHTITDLEGLLELMARRNDDDDREPGSRGEIDLLEFLAYVARAYHDRGGFFTRKMVNEGKADTSTAENAIALWSKVSKMYREGDGQRAAKIAPQESDYALAQRGIEWAKQLTPKNDFENNLHIIANAGYFTFKNTGIAAYVLGAYLREQDRLFMEKPIERQFLPVEQQHHLGTVGERRTFDGYLVGHSYFDGQYGTTHIYRFNIDGCHAVWFASSLQEAFLPPDEREQYMPSSGTWLYPDPPGPFRISATVKRHESDRRDPKIPVTALTRVVVWTLPGMQQADEKAAKKAKRRST